jgi:cytochrome c
MTEGKVTMMKIFRATTEVGNSQRRRFAMNRRATLMLVVGGVAGIAAPSARAGAAELRKREGGRGTSAAATDQAPGARGMKIGMAPQFQDLKGVGPERQVVAIHYHQDSYRVITADGRSADFWEANLRFKIDSSNTGPLSDKPVILPTGMMGDRASVFFASPAEMSTLIKHQS